MSCTSSRHRPPTYHATRQLYLAVIPILLRVACASAWPSVTPKPFLLHCLKFQVGQPMLHSNRLRRRPLCPGLCRHQVQLFLHQLPVPRISILPMQSLTSRPQAPRGQCFSRDFFNKINQLLSVLETPRTSDEWSPSAWSIVGIKRCIDLTLKNSTAPLPLNHRERQTSPIFRRRYPPDKCWRNADRRSQAHVPPGKRPPAIQGAAGASYTVAFTVKRRA